MIWLKIDLNWSGEDQKTRIGIFYGDDSLDMEIRPDR